MLDVIPVDMVVNATLAAAAAPPPVDEPAYYHVGSGARNPLTFRGMYDNIREYFTDHPMPDGGRGQIKAPTWDFPGSRRVERMLRNGERALDVAQRPCWPAPSNKRTRRWQDDLTREKDRLEFLKKYADLYGVYTEAEVIYTDSRLLALHRAMTPERQVEHGFDAAEIDWEHYLQKVHCPAITTTVRRATSGRRGGASSLPALREAPNGGTVAVFDLEGTLVASNVIESYLLAAADRPAAQRLAGELADLVRRMPRYLAAERRDRGEFLRTFMRRYEGADEAGLRRIVREQLGDALLRRSHPQAIRQVRKHRAAGHRTILITGTVDVLVEPLAGLFDEVVASRLHVRDGRFSGFLESPPLVGEARAAWLRRYADTAGLDLANSYAYGDSYSDRPLLEAVGTPVAVNPDPHLYRHAKRKRLGRGPVGRPYAAASDDDRGDGALDDPHARVPPLAGPLLRRPDGDRRRSAAPGPRRPWRQRGAAAAGHPARSAAARRRLDAGHAAPVRHLRLRPRPADRAQLAVPVPVISMPFIPGHEVVGETLDDLPGMPRGTRVVLDPVLGACPRAWTRCRWCAVGQHSRCDHITTGRVSRRHADRVLRRHRRRLEPDVRRARQPAARRCRTTCPTAARCWSSRWPARSTRYAGSTVPDGASGARGRRRHGRPAHPAGAARVHRGRPDLRGRQAPRTSANGRAVGATEVLASDRAARALRRVTTGAFLAQPGARRRLPARRRGPRLRVHRRLAVSTRRCG